jgi:hypothetical protein
VAAGKDIRYFDGTPFVLEWVISTDFAFVRTWSSARPSGGPIPRAFTWDDAGPYPRLQLSTSPSSIQKSAVEPVDLACREASSLTGWPEEFRLASPAAASVGAAEGVDDFGRRDYGSRSRRPASRITTASQPSR